MHPKSSIGDGFSARSELDVVTLALLGNRAKRVHGIPKTNHMHNLPKYSWRDIFHISIISLLFLQYSPLDQAIRICSTSSIASSLECTLSFHKNPFLKFQLHTMFKFHVIIRVVCSLPSSSDLGIEANGLFVHSSNKHTLHSHQFQKTIQKTT